MCLMVRLHTIRVIDAPSIIMSSTASSLSLAGFLWTLWLWTWRAIRSTLVTACPSLSQGSLRSAWVTAEQQVTTWEGPKSSPLSHCCLHSFLWMQLSLAWITICFSNRHVIILNRWRSRVRINRCWLQPARCLWESQSMKSLRSHWKLLRDTSGPSSPTWLWR